MAAMRYFITLSPGCRISESQMNDNDAIASRDNTKLKLARSVRDGREPSLIFIEGIRLFDEAVRSGLDIQHVLISSDVSDPVKLAELPVTQRSTAVKVASRLFDSISDTASSQGVLALAAKPIHRVPDLPFGLMVLLHNVNNPSNLGAVVRTAEAAGVAGLITTTGSADAFSPKALRASMGSAFRLPIVEGLDFDDAIAWARKRGLVSTAADISGESSYLEVDLKIPRLVIFGSEAHGLDDRELASIDEKILIPMENEVESLNLAVSSGIILFEAKRQRNDSLT
jgi:TrmH family RNA methyltransferase